VVALLKVGGRGGSRDVSGYGAVEVLDPMGLGAERVPWAGGCGMG